MNTIFERTIQKIPNAVQKNGILKLVIFDCDGVLVESEHLVSQIIGKEARYYGWDISDQETRELFSGVQLQDIKEAITQHVSRPLPEDWTKTVHQKVVEAMSGDVKPMPGVETILQTLKTLKIPYRVGSNSSKEEMKIKFDKTGLTKWFLKDHIHSAYDVERSKPFPDLYLYAAKQENVSPESCLVIEDSDTGLKAAYDAGMACILLRDLHKPAPNYPGIIRMDSLLKTAEFIKNIVQEQNKNGVA